MPDNKRLDLLYDVEDVSRMYEIVCQLESSRVCSSNAISSCLNDDDGMDFEKRKP